MLQTSCVNSFEQFRALSNNYLSHGHFRALRVLKKASAEAIGQVRVRLVRVHSSALYFLTCLMLAFAF